MKTQSGAISVGAPMSQARVEVEASYAREIGCNNILLLTDEGKEILRRFARSVGADFDLMLEYEKDHKGEISNWIEKNDTALFSFLCAITFTFDLAK